MRLALEFSSPRFRAGPELLQRLAGRSGSRRK